MQWVYEDGRQEVRVLMSEHMRPGFTAAVEAEVAGCGYSPFVAGRAAALLHPDPARREHRSGCRSAYRVGMASLSGASVESCDGTAPHDTAPR